MNSATAARRSARSGVVLLLGSAGMVLLLDAGPAATALPGLTIQALAVDPIASQVIYAATSAGIYRSSDGAATWTLVTPALTYNYFTSIAIDPTDHCVVYGGTYTGLTGANTNAILLRSLDCGATWGIPAGALLGAETVSILITATSPSTLYYSFYANAGSGLTRHSIARSIGGTTTTAFTFEDGRYILAGDPSAPCTVVAGSIFGNARRTTDCGPMNWSTVGSSLGSQIKAIAVHPTNHVSLLAGATGGIYRRTGDSDAWTPVASIPQVSVQAIAYESGNPLVAYAGGSNGVVYKSSDGGTTWPSSSTPGTSVSALAAAPAPSAAMYAGGNAFVTNVGPAAPTVTVTVTAIAPTSGPTAGGTSVTITGTGFVSGATVSIGGVAATGVGFTSATTLTATTGAHAAGVVSVVVTNPDTQAGTLTNGYRYTTPFTDDPLTVGSSVIRTLHITELRTRISALRVRFGLATPTWTDPTLTVETTIIRALHITELRTALAQAYVAAGQTPPVYTDPALEIGTTFKAAHIAEIRTAVVALE